MTSPISCMHGSKRSNANSEAALPVLRMFWRQPSISEIRLLMSTRLNGVTNVERTASRTLRADLSASFFDPVELLAIPRRLCSSVEQTLERAGGVRQPVGMLFEQREELLFLRHQSRDPSQVSLRQ